MGRTPLINATIDKMLEDKFLTIFNNAVKSANDVFNKEFDPLIEGKTPYEILAVFKEYGKEMKTKEESINCTSYLRNATNKEWLIKLFSSRTVLLNVDDAKDLEKAIYLGCMKSLISKHELNLIH